jgi:hypothetical protein
VQPTFMHLLALWKAPEVHKSARARLVECAS